MSIIIIHPCTVVIKGEISIALVATSKYCIVGVDIVGKTNDIVVGVNTVRFIAAAFSRL